MVTRLIVLLVSIGISTAIPDSVSAQVTFEWATVGNAGNAADSLNDEAIPGIGSVATDYRIARYEVTNAQYTEFLDAVAATDTNHLYDERMGLDARGGITRSGSSGGYTYSTKANMGNKPVNYVSFFDAMRFVNWLHNGQPSGAQETNTTEDGVYTISDGVSETRAANARFFIPSENEWYKAAYHQPSAQGGAAGDYWLYPTTSNVQPSAATATAIGDIANPGTNVANLNTNADWNAQDGNVTTVGSAGVGSESFYGTYDQGGNVYEWTEAVIGSFRGFRGGAWGFNGVFLRSTATIQANDEPSSQDNRIGFRVASRTAGLIPTVSGWGLAAMMLLTLTAGTLLVRRRTALAGAALWTP